MGIPGSWPGLLSGGPSRLTETLSLVWAIVMIVLIVGLTYVVSRWYAKRMAGSVNGRHIHVVERVSLGVASALLIVRVGQRYFLLSMSDKQTQLICPLEDFDESWLQDSPTPDSPFGQVLADLLGRRKQSFHDKGDDDPQ